LYEDRFCATERHIDRLQKGTLRLVGVAFFVIFASVVSLVFAEVAAPSAAGAILIGANVVLLVLVLALAFRLAKLGLSVED
jgi:hypothetical protein